MTIKYIKQYGELQYYFGQNSPLIIAAWIFTAISILIGIGGLPLASMSYAYSVSNENIIENTTNRTISQIIDKDISLTNVYTCERDLSTGERVLTFKGDVDFDYNTVPNNTHTNPASTFQRFLKGINLNNIVLVSSETDVEEIQVNSDLSYTSGTSTRFGEMPNIDTSNPPDADTFSAIRLKLYNNQITSASQRCPQSQSYNDMARIYAIYDPSFSAYINDISTVPVHCDDILANPNAYNEAEAAHACGFRFGICLPNPFISNEYVEVTHSKLPITF